MRWFISIASFFLVYSPIYAEQVHIIKSGKDYKSYSHRDLQRRVWDLEMAVFQLQQRIFALESNQGGSGSDSEEPNWICTIKTNFSEFYSATGNTKAVAKDKVIEKCKAANSFDSHCAKVECEH